MAKYNITEIKEKKAAYRSLVSPKMMDQMQEQIMNIIVMQRLSTNTASTMHYPFWLTSVIRI